MVEAKDVTVNVLTSAVTTLVIIFLLIPLLKIPVPAVREVETIETKKYYYPVPVVLEGDYSTWTIYDSFDDADVYAYSYYQYAVVNKDETIILLVDREYLGARKYVIATKTLGALDSEYVFAGLFAGADSDPGTAISIQGSYAVALIRVAGYTTGNGIVVWKNGDLIKTMTATNLGFNTNQVYSVSISKSGKYIVVSGTRTATGNKGWVVLAGS